MQIFVPVQADGPTIRDNGGDVIATCQSPFIAAVIAEAINKDAGFCSMPASPAEQIHRMLSSPSGMTNG